MFTDTAVDFVDNIFRPEAERFSVDDALRHPFITGVVVDPVTDFDIWEHKSDAEEVQNGKLFNLLDQETVAGTGDVHSISQTEEKQIDVDIVTAAVIDLLPEIPDAEKVPNGQLFDLLDQETVVDDTSDVQSSSPMEKKKIYELDISAIDNTRDSS